MSPADAVIVVAVNGLSVSYAATLGDGDILSNTRADESNTEAPSLFCKVHAVDLIQYSERRVTAATTPWR